MCVFHVFSNVYKGCLGFFLFFFFVWYSVFSCVFFLVIFFLCIVSCVFSCVFFQVFFLSFFYIFLYREEEGGDRLVAILNQTGSAHLSTERIHQLAFFKLKFFRDRLRGRLSRSQNLILLHVGFLCTQRTLKNFKVTKNVLPRKKIVMISYSLWHTDFIVSCTGSIFLKKIT